MCKIVLTWSLKQKCTFFQILLSAFMGPYFLYLILVDWVYPMKDYIGETGCYMQVFFRKVGVFSIQLQSFFMALFRYICLIHDKLLRKISLSPNVSKSALSEWPSWQRRKSCGNSRTLAWVRVQLQTGVLLLLRTYLVIQGISGQVGRN